MGVVARVFMAVGQRKTAAVGGCRPVPIYCEFETQPTGLIATACLPFGPSFTSNSTFWFSFRVLKPLPWISEKWAKRSSPPPSGLMKPKPLESLHHFTAPVLIAFPFRLNTRSTHGTGASDKRKARRELKLSAGFASGYWSYCLPIHITAKR